MIEKEIVLCSSCKGEGVLKTHEITDYHRNEYDVIIMECRSCNGEGRLWRTTVTTWEKLDVPISRQ